MINFYSRKKMKCLNMVLKNKFLKVLFYPNPIEFLLYAFPKHCSRCLGESTDFTPSPVLAIHISKEAPSARRWQRGEAAKGTRPASQVQAGRRFPARCTPPQAALRGMKQLSGACLLKPCKIYNHHITSRILQMSLLKTLKRVI